MKLLLVLLTIAAVIYTVVAAYSFYFLWAVGFTDFRAPALAFGGPPLALDIACILLWVKAIRPTQP